jgi:hypothetical protein
VIIALTCLIAVAVLAFVLLVRPRDLSEVEPPSPFAHLDERKASIYENLRDLQFEYRVGKLSDGDYQQSKKDLQKELAAVMAEVDKLKLQLNGSAMPPLAPPAPPAPLQSKPGRGREGAVCSACGAKFEKELKFCGECGKPMKVATK